MNVPFICPHCGREFTMKHHLKRHIDERRCKVLKTLVTKEKPQSDVDERLSMIERRLELQERNTKSNNTLHVICVTEHDNYLEMLTQRIGNFDHAIDYIKNCALSDVSGDCKLIEKIYFDESESIHYVDKSRSKVIYYNEKEEQIRDTKVALGRKLANNLQNSYLKGINYLINKNLSERINPNKFLDDYDLSAWNDHIYHLSDLGYQKKVINQLDIPIVD